MWNATLMKFSWHEENSMRATLKREIKMKIWTPHNYLCCRLRICMEACSGHILTILTTSGKTTDVVDLFHSLLQWIGSAIRHYNANVFSKKRDICISIGFSNLWQPWVTFNSQGDPLWYQMMPLLFHRGQRRRVTKEGFEWVVGLVVQEMR